MISTVRAVGIMGALAVVPMSARADDCATVLSAVFAQAKVPYASTMTTSQPGQPVSRNESVVIGTKMYVQVNGAWQSMPYSAQGMIDRATENAKKAKQTCRKVGAELVDGEATTIYSEHEETSQGIVDSRIWLSDSRALPLKLETHFESGMSFTSTVRYDNIQPPAGAK
jgi:hypothetical protein